MTRTHARRSLLTALACASLQSAWAVRPPETTFLGMEPVRVFRQHPDTQALWARSPAWRAFVDGEGHGWAARFDEATGTPHRMWGPGLDLGPLGSEAQVEAAVLRFVERHAATLGVAGASLAVRSVHHEPTMDAWYVDVDTLRDELPIWRGGLTFRFKQDRLVLVGADTYPGVEIRGSVVLTAQQAVRASIAQGHARQAAHTGHAATAMLLPVEQGGRAHLRAVWVTTTRTEAPVGQWVSFIDAETGELLDVYNEVRFFDGQVHAEHDVRLGDGRTQFGPLPFVHVSAGEAAVFADVDGRFTLPDAEAYTISLEGQRAQIFDQLGVVEPVVPPAPLTELIADDLGGRLAAATTYVYIHQAQDWAIGVAPEVSWSDARVRAFVNVDDRCNAWFDGDLNFLQSGSGCNNTGRLADVIFHEWGHGFHTYSLQSGSYDGSLGEGAADVVAFLLTDDARIAPNFYANGGTLRNVNNNQRYPDDFEDGEQQIHTNGLIFGGAMWHTREALRAEHSEPYATNTTSRLLAGLLKGGPSLETAYEEAVFADDDDGDLSNGTPHQCALLEGFNRHGLVPPVPAAHQPVFDAQPGAAIPVRATLVSPAPACLEIEPAAGTVHYRVDRGPWRTADLTVDGADVRGDLPAGEIGQVYEYWIEVEDQTGAAYTSPASGHIRPHTFYVGDALVVRCDDFERNDGEYTHALLAGVEDEGADDWMWGLPAGLAGDPTRAASGNFVWGNDLGGDPFNGEYQNEKHNRLTSREYNTRHYQDTFLTYQRWLSVEDGVYDKAQILADDEIVWTNWASSTEDGSEHHLDDAWVEHVVDLGSAGDDGRVVLSWDLITDQGLAFGGWTIDDVCVMAPATADNRLGIHDFTVRRDHPMSPASLRWTNPEHAPLLAIKVVRKSGGYPTGPDDGLVLWSTDAPELAAEVSLSDPAALGKADIYYAVYASDGEDWLSWTVEGWNAGSIAPLPAGNGGCGCSNGAAGSWWVLTLGLGLIRRRRS